MKNIRRAISILIILVLAFTSGTAFAASDEAHVGAEAPAEDNTITVAEETLAPENTGVTAPEQTPAPDLGEIPAPTNTPQPEPEQITAPAVSPQPEPSHALSVEETQTPQPTEIPAPKQSEPPIKAEAISGYYEYTDNSDGTVSIKKFTGSMTYVNIPATLNGKIVSAISSTAFTGNTYVDYISIPNGVKSISIYAFKGCVRLQQITIPSSVTSIGTDAFSNCPKTLVIKCYEGSTAHQYAQTNGITFELLTDPEPPAPTPLFEYSQNTDDITGNTITITKYKGTETTVNVPGTIDGKKVSIIAPNAFINNTSITSVTISSGVKSIGQSAFSGCTNLTSVDLPSTLTSIGQSAFFKCGKLSNITIPTSVKTIEQDAFASCSSLTNITVPNSVTSLGDGAFNGCSGLKSVVLSNYIDRISNSLFEGCTSLTTINIPSNQTNIPLNASEIGQRAFYGCTALTDITLSTIVKTISANAFTNCTNLKSITIPKNVTSIATDAFKNCANVVIKCYTNSTAHQYAQTNHINFELLDGETPITPQLFDYSENSDGTITVTKYKGTETSVTVPAQIDGKQVTGIEGSTDHINGAFDNKVTAVVLPLGLKIVGDYAFYCCTSLTSVTIPNSVTSIGFNAFSNCTNLKSITIPSSVTSIGDNAFSLSYPTISCYKNSQAHKYAASNRLKYTLIDAQKPEGSFDYADNADGTVTLLTYTGNDEIVTIPSKSADGKTVTSIGENAFSQCTYLTSVTIPSSVTSIGEGAFYDCSRLTNITIPNSVTSIGNQAFSRCTNLTNITIPSGVTSIGYSTFSGCTNLNSVNIPSSVTSIGDSAFYDCTNLTNITIPSGVTSIGKWAFNGCTSLTSIGLPNSITLIDMCAFSKCKNLTNITIPSSVTSIGTDAFYECSNLVIKCYNNSTAHNYAQTNSIRFELLDGELPVTPALFEYSENSDGTITVTKYTGTETTVTVPETIGGKQVVSLEGYIDPSPKICSVFNDKVTTVVLPTSLKTIGDLAFYACSSLTSVNIPSGVTAIGKKAFMGCKNLVSVNIPASVTSLDECAFADCGIVSLSIPNSVTSLGKDAFSGNSNLTSVTIPGSVTSLGENAFFLCLNLKSVTIDSGVTSIGNYAFYSCSNLTSITIPKSVTTIGTEVFEKCSNLVIKCYKDSTAHNYAIANNIKFKLLDGDTPQAPATPDMPTLTASYGQITANWSAVENANGYEVYLSTTDKSVGSLYKTVDENTLSATITNLTPGTKYYICVRAYAETDSKKYYSDYSPVNSAVPTLANVSTFKATAAGFDCVNLSWSKAAGAKGYYLTYSIDNRRYYSYATVNGASSVSFAATRLAPNTTYYFKIQPYCGALKGGLTTSNAIKTLGAAPAEFTAAVKSPTCITMSWGAVSGASGYDIWRQAGSGKAALVKTNKASVRSFNDTKVAPGTAYTYTVRSFVTISGNKYFGTWSNVSTVKPTIATPANFAVTAKSASSAYISWDVVPGVSGYELWRAVNGGRYAMLKDLTSRSYTNTNMMPGAKYGYIVRAYVTVDGKKYYSGWSPAKTAAPTIGGAPTNFAATVKSPSSAYLSWDSVPGITGYEIWRSANNGSYTLAAKTSASSRSFTNTSLPPGVTYSYKIRAYVESAGNKYFGSWSNVSTIKPTIDTPANFAVTAKSASSAYISWDAVPGASGYELWRSIYDGRYAMLKDLTSRSYTNTNMVAGVKYGYILRAYVTVGGKKYYSDWSTASDVTQPKVAA